jgi:hypothetical protein
VQSTVLDHIPFQVDIPQLFHMLHLEDGSDDAYAARRLIAEAETIARPKALSTVGYIDSKADDAVAVNGVTLTSRVLRVNLEGAQRVFVYVATCGTELEAWGRGKDDIMESFWADGIMLQAVRSAGTALTAFLEAAYRPGRLAHMNPGSLQDWPLREQRPLFSLAGDVEERIGVRLTDSYLMVPAKSVSGLYFPTEETFESCQLCGREVCPNRRAPFDPALFDRKYGQTTT